MLVFDKYLFTDLKAGDRIDKVIETYIFPDLEKLGFKLSKSKPLKITRSINDFEQEIFFQKCKDNGTELVAFLPHFSVRCKTYKKWHKNKYGIETRYKKEDDLILGYKAHAHDIPGWTNDYFGALWYDLTK